MTHAQRAAQDVKEQRRWIERHGGNQAGYVIHYAADGVYAVEEAIDIYRADVDRLVHLIDVAFSYPQNRASKVVAS